MGDFSPPDGMFPKDKAEEKIESLGLKIEYTPLEVEQINRGSSPGITDTEFNLEDGVKIPSVEHQFIPNFISQSPLHENERPSQKKAASENLASLRKGSDEDMCVSLHLGDNEAKRRRSDGSGSEESK